MKNLHVVLFCVLFLIAGFVLGRVTGHPGPGNPHRGCAKGASCERGPGGCERGHGAKWVQDGGHEEVEVMLLTDEALAGDSVFSLPGGGTVHVTRSGDEVDVQVEVETVGEDGTDEGLRIEKRVIVVREDDNP
jgi:hypothetical protein